jgi:hypothetical protein
MFSLLLQIFTKDHSLQSALLEIAILVSWVGWVSDPARHGSVTIVILGPRNQKTCGAKAHCLKPLSPGAVVASAAPDHRIAGHRGISRLTRLDGTPPGDIASLSPIPAHFNDGSAVRVLFRRPGCGPGEALAHSVPRCAPR